MHDVEPVVQVLAEAALADLLLQVPVRGGDDAHVDMKRLLASYALERTLLQDTQYLDLGVLVDLPDLVQEDGASVRKLEAALLLADGTGERALLMTEELAFQKRRRQRCAVDLDERPLAAVREAVYRIGDELLARAALPCDQD